MPNTPPPPLPTYRFRRIDAVRNMARFYMLSLEPTLFGEVAVLRHWGRIGTRGRQALNLYPSLAEAETVLARQVALRRRRGYVEA
ncbi:WGR domain-containing protein [Shinella sp. JR1-6]|uniref:WGR domain-containing protein n=1 Tax=Shinella sp. JR1-6 TaxID=2527671 RepID=UPI00102D658A|nr:WGR domain-containing protein [Shinella sp. JR1-6]TAA63956.1 WGR domain-containing protein [Shinella sp. JR1-6]